MVACLPDVSARQQGLGIEPLVDIRAISEPASEGSGSLFTDAELRGLHFTSRRRLN